MNGHHHSHHSHSSPHSFHNINLNNHSPPSPPPTTNHNNTLPPLHTVTLQTPVDEDQYQSQQPDELYYDNNYGIYNQAMSRNISWEYKTLTLTRVPGYGFGIAVSGGSDNPHFANGDPAIAISDVLKGGPAEGKLNINDRIITANGIKLENVDYGTAVQVLRDSGPSVSLIIKRRIIAHHTKLTLNKITSTKLKHIQPSDYAINLTLRVYIKDSKNSNLVEGDEIISINGLDVAKLFDFRKGCVANSEGKLVLGVVKQQQQGQVGHQDGRLLGGVNHQNQQSYDSAAGNLYVQPPTRRMGKDNVVLPVRPPLPDSLTPPPPPPPPPNHPILVTKSNPRFINFLKKASCPLGLKVVGGNNVGIFIGALQPSTPAASSGLLPGDQIIRVNDTDFTRIPRDAAVATLSNLMPDTLVSFIVKQVENYRELLAGEECHDLLWFRVGEPTTTAQTGEICLISDTLSPSTGSYTGHILNKYDGRPLPNRKVHLNKNSLLLTPVIRIKVAWARPILLFSPIAEHIFDCLEKIKGRRRFLSVTGTPDEVKGKLGQLRHEMVHGLVVGRGTSGVEVVAGFCPIVIVVRTEDKVLLKKGSSSNSREGGGGKYSSLLRSFNKSSNNHNHPRNKSSTSLDKVESELGGWIDGVLSVTSSDNIGEVVGRKIEEVLGRVGEFGWVEENSSCAVSGSGGGGMEQQTTPSTTTITTTNRHNHQTTTNKNPPPEIPNYNLPPPFSIQNSTSSTPFSNNNSHPEPPSPQKLLPKPHPSQQTTRKDANYYYSSSSTLRQLAHSPVDNYDTEPKQSAAQPPPPPPQIDRTKKPVSINLTNGKPIPPPKPVKITQQYRRERGDNDDNQGYYLNLPVNSRIVQQHQQQQNVNNGVGGGVKNLNQNQNLNNSSTSAFAQFTKMPLLQPNTSSGTFSYSGGILTQRNCKPGQIPIEVFIPEGAIPRGKSETIFFHVVDEEFLDSDFVNGNLSIMSPLIKFGPENLRFEKPIEIRIPQYNKRDKAVNNAKVLLNSEQSWSRVDIKGGFHQEEIEEDVKIVSLTVQKF